MFWANRDIHGRPGDRRAGCPHPAGPCGGINAPGGYGIRPYERGKARGQPGTYEPGNVANLCRGRCLHRPANIAAARTPTGGINPAPTNRGKARGQPGTCEPGNVTNLCRGRFYIGPVCGGAGFRGRDLRPKSRRCAAVGLRNAPAGGINPAPTNKFYVLGQPGQPRPPGRT